jgi:MFS family permease
MLASIASEDFRSSHTISTHKTPTIDRKVVILVGIALFCDYLLLSLCIPILPELLGDAYSPLKIGVVFASKPFFQFFANPVMGNIVDNIGPHKPLFTGTLVLSLSTFCFAYGVSLQEQLVAAYAIVIIARSIQGVASACIMSAGMTLIAQRHSDTNRGAAMGLAMTGVALGTLLGPPLGGILGFYGNLWMPFVLVAGILILVFVFQVCGDLSPPERDEATERLLNPSSESFAGLDSDDGRSSVAMRLTDEECGGSAAAERRLAAASTMNTCTAGSSRSERESRAKEEELLLPPASIGALLQDPHILFIGMVAVIGNSAIGMIEPLVPQYLDKEFGESLLFQGLIFGCASLAYLLFTPMAGYMSDVCPKWTCLATGLLVMGLGLGAFLLAGTVWMVCVCLALVGGGMAFIDTPILPLLADVVEVRGCNTHHLRPHITMPALYNMTDHTSCVVLVKNWIDCWHFLPR